jgi:uncharacterized protein (TIGR02996 family)
MDAQSAALLEKLAQAPDDIDLHLVVADQLTEMGDPRGELITLQVALDRDPNNRQLLLPHASTSSGIANSFWRRFSRAG